MTPPPPIVRILGVAALIVSAALALYWAIEDAGLYHFLAQSRWLGGEAKITVLLTWLILFFAMAFPITLFYRFTRLSEEKIETVVPSTEAQAAALREQKIEQKILGVSKSFKKIRSLVLMGTLLLAGTTFGILRLIQLIQGELTDPTGLVVAWICALVGIGMFFQYRRAKRK